MYIHREIETQVHLLSRSFPVLMLTGARQTGKTTLLKHCFPVFTYVSLDLPSIAAMAEDTPDQFLRAYPPPVLIDEVQYAPKLFRHLKTTVDQNRHLTGQFILAGSQNSLS